MENRTAFGKSVLVALEIGVSYVVTEKQRWPKRERNFVVGEVVLIKTETSRNQWPIGRVTEAILSKDGLVRSVEVK